MADFHETTHEDRVTSLALIRAVVEADSEAITALLEGTDDLRGLATALAFHGGILAELVADARGQAVSDFLKNVQTIFNLDPE